MVETRRMLHGFAMLFGVMAVLALATAAPAAAMGGTEDTGCAEPADGAAEGAADGAAVACPEDPADGAGDGAADAGGAAGASDVKLTCPEGFELSVNETTKEPTCKQKSSSLMNELPAVGWQGADPAFVEAAVLAHSGQYERAIEAFSGLGRPDDPYVLNYLGYSNRKLGNLDAALAYYHKALSIRPDYVRVREYLGEGLVAAGRVEEAREQLALIEDACGTGCAEYRALETAITDYLAASQG